MSAKLLQKFFKKRLDFHISKVIPHFRAVCVCFHTRGVFSLTQDEQMFTRNVFVLQCVRPARHPWIFHRFSLGQVKFYSTESEVEEIDYDELCQKLKECSIILIDVREPKELVERGTYTPYYPSVINIPLRDIEDALSMSENKFRALYKAELPDPEDSEIIFSCAMGIRSMHAATLAKQIGYKRAKSYRGGYEEWREKNEKL